MTGLALCTGCLQGPSGVAQLPAPQVVVQPVTVTVTSGKSTRFTARVLHDRGTPIQWRVVEPGGGSMDAAGFYKAPGKPGTYTVQAGVQGGTGAAARVTVVAPPSVAIQAPAKVMPGAVGLTAHVPRVPGSVYSWSAAGGRITAGEDASSATFEAGAGPKVVLTCRVANAAGDALTGSLAVPVAPPVALSITPSQVTLTAGRSMKFGYTIEGGVSLNVRWMLGEPGAGSLDGQGRYVAPPAPGNYTVRVASVDDPTRVAIARVKVVEKPPEGLVAPDGFTAGQKDLRAIMPDVPGMTYAWEIDGGSITAGDGTAAVTFTAGDGPQLTVRCKVTNEAGDSFQATRVVNLVSQ